MTATRPKLDPAVIPEVRKWLRSPMGAGLNPGAAGAVIRSTPAMILGRVEGNPWKLWDVAFALDQWASRRHGAGSDGGVFDLATALYDHAEAVGLPSRPGRYAVRWRDAHPESAPVAVQGPVRAPLTAPRRRVCGCGSCRWEQPHPGAAA